jgi:hypothetical protein
MSETVSLRGACAMPVFFPRVFRHFDSAILRRKSVYFFSGLTCHRVSIVIDVIDMAERGLSAKPVTAGAVVAGRLTDI